VGGALLWGAAALSAAVAAVVDAFTCRSMLSPIKKVGGGGGVERREKGSPEENVVVLKTAELTAFVFFRQHNRRIKASYCFVQAASRYDSKQPNRKQEQRFPSVQAKPARFDSCSSVPDRHTLSPLLLCSKKN
jgi:hypothetical protein